MTPLDPTLLERLKAESGKATFALDLLMEWPALLAHIESQYMRLSAVSGLVEALELFIGLDPEGRDITDEQNIARAALAAWRKNHG